MQNKDAYEVVVDDSLRLSKKIKVLGGIKGTCTQIVYPTHVVSPQNTQVFEFEARQIPYAVRYNSFRVGCWLDIVTADGSKLTTADRTLENAVATPHVAPVDGFAHQLWKSVRLRVNGTELTRTDSHYGIIAHHNHLIQTNAEQKKLSKLEGYHDGNIDWSSEAGSDHVARGLQFLKSQKVYVEARIKDAIFDSSYYCMPGSTMQLSLERNSDKYLLIVKSGAVNYRMRIHDLHLKMTATYLDDHGLNLIKQQPSLKHMVLAPYWEVDMRLLNEGNDTYEFRGINQHRIGEKLNIIFIPKAAFQGTYDTSPTTFKRLELDSIVCNVQGQIFPSTPIVITKNESINATYNSTLRHFMEFIHCNQMENAGVSHTQYHYKHTIYTIPIAPSAAYASVRSIEHSSPQFSVTVKLHSNLGDDLYMFVLSSMAHVYKVQNDQSILDVSHLH